MYLTLKGDLSSCQEEHFPNPVILTCITIAWHHHLLGIPVGYLRNGKDKSGPHLRFSSSPPYC